jgi:3-phytase
MRFKILPLLLALVTVACQPAVEPPIDVVDSSIRAASIAADAQTTPTLTDGATDPAIWIDNENPGASLILGSGSAGGLEIYDLSGARVGVAGGREIGLVDIRYNFPLAGGAEALVVAYDLESAAIIAYALDAENRSLSEVTATPLETRAAIEGLCMYQSPLSGKYYVFAAGDGMIQQWELYPQDGEVAGRRIRDIPVGFGAAHCVAHDRSSSLYFSQETVGVFKINAEPESEPEKEIVDVVQPLGHFVGDVKGIAIQQYADSGYLIVSDADVSRLQFYDVESHEHAGTLAIDEVEEAEGLAATSVNLSSGYEGGLLVLTDDDNGSVATNYKFVSWGKVVSELGLAGGVAHDPTVSLQRDAVTVSATVETEPVATFGDAADDPAIWVHPENPELSLIIGSQKKHGINVYDLSGNLLQSRADGHINNVDLRYDFPLGGQSVAIVTGSNRSTDSVSIYSVDAGSRMLIDVADGIIPTGMIDPYGACMYRSQKTDQYYVFINDTSGIVKQWLLKDNGKQKVAAELVREFAVGSQTEGCVADDQTGALYVGEEDIGIWKYSAEPDGSEDRTLVDSTDENGNLTDDVEGLAIFYGDGDSGYLVASNQGADNYALYERGGENKFVGLFHVVADDVTGIDGSSETDGLDVSSANFGPDFPGGLLVVQDGRNITPYERQNFKLVPWQRISDAMELE